MMDYKFTKSANKALELASEVAIKLGHNYVGTEHLLYGLAEEKTGVAGRVLEKQDITSEKILDDIEGEEYSGQSIEDIAEDIMNVSTPQYSEKKQRMYEAAEDFFDALENGDT